MKQKQQIKRLFGAALLAMALVCGLALAGCEETTTEDHAYNFGIYEFSGSLSDLGTIESDLKSKGCIMGTQVYSGSSSADCNAKAQVYLNESKVKIDSSTFASINGSFTYTCKGDNGFTGNGFSY
jgi:hypothetical protein